MGTDIYLSWNKQTKEEKEKQITGFRIDAGQNGYLRASIGMVEENGILREIFSEQYWNGQRSKQYNFEMNLQKTEVLLKQYLLGGSNAKVIEAGKTVTEYGHMLQTILQKLPFKVETGVNGTGLDGQERMLWAKSVFEFCQLGAKLQRNGREPKIYISW